ncbi:hypothetical protein C8R43DRAFT_960542 [Mycena crocata]|nr:hypothetical protein C8R43DRAFT_960542 [Mycena crocata]
MQPSPIFNGGTPIPPPAAVPGALCHANPTPHPWTRHTLELSRSGGNINYYMYRRPASGIKSQRTLPKEKHRRRPNHRRNLNSTCSEELPLCGGIAITRRAWQLLYVSTSAEQPASLKFQREPKELLGSGTTRTLRATKRRIIWTHQVANDASSCLNACLAAKRQSPTALTRHIDILSISERAVINNIPTEHPDFTVLGSFSRVSIAYLMNPTATWQITSFWPSGRENPCRNL